MPSPTEIPNPLTPEHARCSRSCADRKGVASMKLFSANIEDLRTLYINSLKKALDMEQQITEALPTMIKKSTDPQLATAFRDHLQQTHGHIDKVASLLND